MFAEVLIQELNLERNRIPERDRARRVPPELCRSGTPLVSYAAAAGIAAETALDERGPDAALAALEDMWLYARRDRLPALARFLGALRVSFLADAMRPAEAERAWRTARLPRTPAAILDLRGQSWREFEALACARVRLLAARGDFDPARSLCRALVDVAARSNLKRTAMRALALSVALEEQAGRRAAAMRRLDAFFRLFETTDYARPLVRERRTVLPAVEDFVQRDDGTPRASAAKTLLPALRSGHAAMLPSPPRLSARQSEVLRRLDTHSDREIAAALGLTRDGVRYHVRNLFATLRVHNRRTPHAARAHSGCCPSTTDAAGQRSSPRHAASRTNPRLRPAARPFPRRVVSGRHPRLPWFARDAPAHTRYNSALIAPEQETARCRPDPDTPLRAPCTRCPNTRPHRLRQPVSARRSVASATTPGALSARTLGSSTPGAARASSRPCPPRPSAWPPSWTTWPPRVAPATVRRYVASIAAAHGAMGRDRSATNSPADRLALQRMHRAKGRRQAQALGLTWPLRQRLLAAAGDRLIDLRNRALLAVAYDTMLRRSELAALKASDLVEEANGAATLLVRRGKTDPDGSGAVVYAARDTMRIVRAWVSRGRIADGFLFRSLSRTDKLGESLDPSQIPRIFKAMARAAGLPEDVAAGLSGHSARVGATQDMIASGIELAAILQAGRWKTTAMVNRYGERLMARRSGAAQLAKLQRRE